MRLNIRALVAGGLLGAAFVLMFQQLGYWLFPVPWGFDPKNPVLEGMEMGTFLSKVGGNFLFVVLGWMAGLFVAGAIAARFAPSAARKHAIVVGAILIAIGYFNMSAFPSANLFLVLALLCLPMAVWGANRLGSPEASS